MLPALDLDDAAPRQRLCRTAQPDRLRLARARLKQRRIHARAQQLFQICGPLLFKEARNIHFAQRRHIGMQHLCVQRSRYNARVLVVKQMLPSVRLYGFSASPPYTAAITVLSKGNAAVYCSDSKTAVRDAGVFSMSAS